MHNHDNLKELNEYNTELYINDKKMKYKKYFKPEKEGIYSIILKININIKDCSYMFSYCNKLTDIDLTKAISRNEDIINEQPADYDDEQLYIDEEYSEEYVEDEVVPEE